MSKLFGGLFKLFFSKSKRFRQTLIASVLGTIVTSVAAGIVVFLKTHGVDVDETQLVAALERLAEFLVGSITVLTASYNISDGFRESSSDNAVDGDDSHD